MNKDSSKKDRRDAAAPEWHPYTVWQQRIRDAETNRSQDDENVTGSWRTDAVWQNLIKG